MELLATDLVEAIKVAKGDVDCRSARGTLTFRGRAVKRDTCVHGHLSVDEATR
jgi:hypothetical protein